jgi:hypothetical protein
MDDDLYFDTIKEKRRSYFVEYDPPIADHAVASLNLVFPQAPVSDRVADLMLAELRHWIGRYPVPLMIWAWDDKEDMITPEGQSENCLVGWPISDTGEIAHSWNIDDLSAHLKSAVPLPDWRIVYSDVKFRMDAEVKAEAKKNWDERRRQIITLKVILSLWLAAFPAAWAVFELLGPAWLGVLVLGYTLWKAWQTGREIWGHKKPSRSEEKKAEKQRKMAHYFYHCERNPDGFARLKIENFEKDRRERIRKEAEDLQ